jgi:hypothetical protein
VILADRTAGRRAARQLALSGPFSGWKEIEDKIGQSLYEPFERSEIDRLCKEAQRRNKRRLERARFRPAVRWFDLRFCSTSHPVDAKRRPTGSARQSRATYDALDCFVASAPRNDGKIRVHLNHQLFAPVPLTLCPASHGMVGPEPLKKIRSRFDVALDDPLLRTRLRPACRR